MNFNQLTAAAAAAAANTGLRDGAININNFSNVISSLFANGTIDMSQLANLGGLGQSTNLTAAGVQQPTSRQNLPQAHHRGLNSTSSGAGLSLNSNAHLPSSVSNMQNADAVASAVSAVGGLPASITNLTSSALANLTSGAHLQPTAHSGRSSIQSAHHRTSSNHHHHHHNHHSSSTQLTAAHQSTSAGKGLAAHHQSQNTIHHRHSSHNTSAHNTSSSSNHNASINNISNSINNNNSHNSIMSNNNNNNNNSINNNNTVSNSNPLQTIIATNNSSSITPPKSSTCYRIGDCIYFDSPTSPSQIGRIDEICKTNGDSIQVKVVVFFKRREMTSSLMTLADKYQYDESQEEEIKQMSEKEKHTLKQRELFYSRQIETIPASSIRGKCTVQLLNESESLASYINKDDHYFYTLVYDPQQKTITADRGEIRVGQRYQAEAQPNPIYSIQPGGDPADPRDLTELETLVYTPDHNLTDDDINKFLTIAKSVGTFARALDCSSSIKQPSLHLTAASASRDVTLLYAMQLLHQNDYDLGKAVCALVPSTGPVLCRDEIEEWTAGEATLFEEAIEKYGREFGDIRQDFLPWKSVKNIVEYYYMWKTTDRSINQRRMKALEAENKVTVLYIKDPENEMKKSPSNNVATASVGTDAANNAIEPQVKTTRSLKRLQESDESSLTSSIENPNATQKRRQVTEPKLSAHVALSTTRGGVDELKFIATQRHKNIRKEQFTRKQLRHLSRQPWKRIARSQV